MIIIKRVFCMELATAGYVIGCLGIPVEIFEVILMYLGITMHEPFIPRRITSRFFIAMLVISVLNLLSSILLVYGIKKNSHKAILPWLYIKVIVYLLLIGMTLLIILLTGLFLVPKYMYMVLSLLCIVLAIYCCSYMVIYLLYKFIRDEVSRERHQSDSEGLYAHCDPSAI